MWGKNKFKAKRTIVDGIAFASQLEANVYAHHVILQASGIIKDLQIHPTYRLTDAEISYKCDFQATNIETGTTYAIEAKGMEDRRWMLIKKLWVYYGPMPLEVWKSKGKRVLLDKTITPKHLTA